MNAAIYFSGRIKNTTVFEQHLNYISKVRDDIVSKGYSVTLFCSLNENDKNEECLNKFIDKFSVTPECINLEETRNPEELFMYKKAHETNIYNTYSMYYHNYKCMTLIEKYSKQHNITFNLVIKLRSDLQSKSPFLIEDTINEKSIYIPNGNDWGGINDQIAYGDFESMKIYSNCVHYIPHMCETGTRFHPETLLNTYLLKRLNIYRYNYSYGLFKYM